MCTHTTIVVHSVVHFPVDIVIVFVFIFFSRADRALRSLSTHICLKTCPHIDSYASTYTHASHTFPIRFSMSESLAWAAKSRTAKVISRLWEHLQPPAWGRGGGPKRRPRIDPPPPPPGVARPRGTTPADDSVVDPTTVQNHPRPTANMALDFAATYKVLVLGDSNVGKTCIVHRYCDERYYDTYISTIGERRIYTWQIYRINRTYPWLRATTSKLCWWLKSFQWLVVRGSPWRIHATFTIDLRIVTLFQDKRSQMFNLASSTTKVHGSTYRWRS